VFEKLDFLVRFWELKARHATLGQPLSAREQVELLGLMQLVTHDLELPEPGPIAAHEPPLGVELIGEGVILGAEIRAVSAGGLVVIANARPAAGAQICVRAADAIGGLEYTLPCRVAWTYGRDPITLALVIDGVPSRIRFGVAADPQGGAERRDLVPLSMPFVMGGRTQRLLG
jgi:hypothetical protein